MLKDMFTTSFVSVIAKNLWNVKHEQLKEYSNFVSNILDTEDSKFEFVYNIKDNPKSPSVNLYLKVNVNEMTVYGKNISISLLDYSDEHLIHLITHTLWYEYFTKDQQKKITKYIDEHSCLSNTGKILFSTTINLVSN